MNGSQVLGARRCSTFARGGCCSRDRAGRSIARWESRREGKRATSQSKLTALVTEPRMARDAERQFAARGRARLAFLSRTSLPLSHAPVPPPLALNHSQYKTIDTMALPFRSISLCAALLSALFNLACTVRIILSWRTLRWDFSGVDTDTFPGSVDALHLLWGLLTLYFASATTASITGFIGIIRVCFSLVARTWRDSDKATCPPAELAQLCAVLP